MNRLNRLIPLQLHHQVREATIRLHQLRRRTDESISQLTHAAKKAVLENPLRLIHKVGELNRKAIDTILIARDGGDLRNDYRLAVTGMYSFQVLNADVAIGAVVVEANVVRWVGRGEVHELLEPSLPIFVIRDRGSYEFLSPMLSQRHHLGMPSLRRALGGDIVLIRLVEEMDDGLVAVEDVLPVAA